MRIPAGALQFNTLGWCRNPGMPGGTGSRRERVLSPLAPGFISSVLKATHPRIRAVNRRFMWGKTGLRTSVVICLLLYQTVLSDSPDPHTCDR